MKLLLLATLMICGMLVKCSVTTPATQAMDMYRQYADRMEGLTVAYVGGYQSDDREYQAVVFQPADSAQWTWLKREFGMDDTPVQPTDISQQGSLAERRPGDMPSASRGHAMRVRSFRKGLGEVLTTTQPQGPVAHETLHDTAQVLLPLPRFTIGLSRPGQPDYTEQRGYVVGLDDTDRVLCLLFYENRDEEQAILSRVEQIIAAQADVPAI